MYCTPRSKCVLPCWFYCFIEPPNWNSITRYVVAAPTICEQTKPVLLKYTISYVLCIISFITVNINVLSNGNRPQAVNLIFRCSNCIENRVSNSFESLSLCCNTFSNLCTFIAHFSFWNLIQQNWLILWTLLSKQIVQEFTGTYFFCNWLGWP